MYPNFNKEIPKWKTENSKKIHSLACDGMNYLDKRSKFWNQEKPLYAILKSKHGNRNKKLKDNNRTKLTMSKILEKLHQIDHLQHSEDHCQVLNFGQKLIKKVESTNESEFPNKLEVLANVYSMLGLSYLEMNNFDEAFKAHSKAHKLGEQCNLHEIVSHALDNLGRIHAKKGDYESAVKLWETKLKTCRDDLDSIWLHYELGRCYLELSKPDLALNYGQKALDIATKLSDASWHLNLNVLIGQANLKMKRHMESQKAFSIALDLSKELQAHEAEEAILKVMYELQVTEYEVDNGSLTYNDEETENGPTKSPEFADELDDDIAKSLINEEITIPV